MWSAFRISCSNRRALQSRQVTDDSRIEELQQRIQKTAKEAAEAEHKYQEVLLLSLLTIFSLFNPKFTQWLQSPREPHRRR